jgi:hypothetical protein
MIKTLMQLEVEAYLVGSYSDDQRVGLDVVQHTLALLHSSTAKIFVRLFCCSDLNTTATGKPQATALCYLTSQHRPTGPSYIPRQGEHPHSCNQLF